MVGRRRKKEGRIGGERGVFVSEARRADSAVSRSHRLRGELDRGIGRARASESVRALPVSEAVIDVGTAGDAGAMVLRNGCARRPSTPNRPYLHHHDVDFHRSRAKRCAAASSTTSIQNAGGIPFELGGAARCKLAGPVHDASPRSIPHRIYPLVFCHHARAGPASLVSIVPFHWAGHGLLSRLLPVPRGVLEAEGRAQKAQHVIRAGPRDAEVREALGSREEGEEGEKGEARPYETPQEQKR